MINPNPSVPAARNADLDTMLDILNNQHARKLDFVVPAHALDAQDGNLLVAAPPIIENDGVTQVGGVYTPTRIADDGIAEKLNIPSGYLNRCRTLNLGLYDSQVNGWLRHENYAHKNYLLRTFLSSNGTGVLRAFLSDEYNVDIDNLDVLAAVLAGVRAAGVDAKITGCDLSDARMYVRMACPEVSALAPVLLSSYTDPFTDPDVRRAGNLEHWRELARREGLGFGEGNEPIVYAGLTFSNSEVGLRAFSMAPEIVAKICANGLTITRSAQRTIHHGVKLPVGPIKWSEDTRRKTLDATTAKVRDSVKTWLSPEFLTKEVAKIEAAAGVRVKDPTTVVEIVGKKLAYTEAERSEIFAQFIRGGQMTAGGVANAVTTVAQTLINPDDAARLTGSAIEAMALVATL